MICYVLRSEYLGTELEFCAQDLIGGDIRNDAAASPVLSLQIEYASPIKDVQTPLFSPAGLPRPGRIVEEVWTAHDVCGFPLYSRNWLTSGLDRIFKCRYLVHLRGLRT